MGLKTRHKYQSDKGNILYVLVDDSAPQTLIGTEPSDAETENMTVRLSKNNQEVGIRPRFAVLSRTIGTEGKNSDGRTTQTKAYRSVAVLTKSHLDSLTVGTEVSFTGETEKYKIARKVAERVK